MVKVRRVSRASPGALPSEVADSIRRLDRRCFPADDPVVLTGAWWWVAYDGATPVGYAGLKPEGGDRYSLVRVGVLAAYRGCGLGRRLLKVRMALARRLSKHGVLKTYVWANNPESANNLIRQGFRVYRNSRRTRDFVYLRLRF